MKEYRVNTFTFMELACDAIEAPSSELSRAPRTIRPDDVRQEPRGQVHLEPQEDNCRQGLGGGTMMPLPMVKPNKGDSVMIRAKTDDERNVLSHLINKSAEAKGDSIDRNLPVEKLAEHSQGIAEEESLMRRGKQGEEKDKLSTSYEDPTSLLLNDTREKMTMEVSGKERSNMMEDAQDDSHEANQRSTVRMVRDLPPTGISDPTGEELSFEESLVSQGSELFDSLDLSLS